MTVEMLDELEQNITSSQIDNHQRKILKLKEILSKNQSKRTPIDINELISIFSEIAFFKERKDITPSDFRELVQLFEIKKAKAGENIITFGESPQYFYLILSGKCSVSVPNPAIRGWSDRYRNFKDLQRWYQNKILPKIENAKTIFLEN